VNRESQASATERTLKVWQPRSPQTLTPEDAREIQANVLGFFRVLCEWAAEDRDTARVDVATPPKARKEPSN
jgi:hypothetical protein